MRCAGARTLLAGLVLPLLSGCLVDTSGTGGVILTPPWERPRVQVIDGERGVRECLAGDTGPCLAAGECGPGVAADVLLARDGDVLEVVCYPGVAERSREEID